MSDETGRPAHSAVRLVFLGPPGAGKGTQAKLIGQRRGLTTISTGDILRRHVTSGSSLGTLAKSHMDSGGLPPSDLVTSMVRDRLGHPDAAGGFLLDGFPRTIDQAVGLDVIGVDLGWSIDAAISFDIDQEELIDRLSGRRTCRYCASVWHVTRHPTSDPWICDNCGGALFERVDDSADVVRTRLDVYNANSEHVLSHYRRHALLHSIDATGSVSDVADRIAGVVSLLHPVRSARQSGPLNRSTILT